MVDFNNDKEWLVSCTTDEVPLIPDFLKDQPEVKTFYQKRAAADRLGTCANVTSKIPAKIPGEIHQHLKDAGILKDDVLYRFEHINQQWVAFQKWRYESEFDMEAFNDNEEHVLQISGVGVIANVSINGH